MKLWFILQEGTREPGIIDLASVCTLYKANRITDSEFARLLNSDGRYPMKLELFSGTKINKVNI